MPSLHTVWALLILWNAARLGWRWRLPLTLFAALNVWAAIGHYQHWFIDLVVAVPLATALQAAIVDARPGAARRRAVAAAGAVIGLSWIVALRTGLLLGTPSWLAWLLVVLTVVVPPGVRHRAVQ